MFRLTSFLKRAPAISRAEFVRRWRTELDDSVMHNAAVRRSVRSYVVNLPMIAIPPEHLWIAADDFDGVAELWFDDLPAAILTGNALAADPAVAQAAAGMIDTVGSISWIGAVVEDFDTPGIAIKRMVAGQQRPDLSLEQAQDYWLHEHSAFFQSYPDFMAYMLRYRPIYGIPTTALNMTSYHLMALHADVGFRSLADLSAAYREPNHARDMMTDITKFGAQTGAITFTSDAFEVRLGSPRA